MAQYKTKRNRGVNLTLHRWDKLQAAKTQEVFDETAFTLLLVFLQQYSNRQGG